MYRMTLVVVYKLSIQGRLVFILALNQEFVDDHQSHPVLSVLPSREPRVSGVIPVGIAAAESTWVTHMRARGARISFGTVFISSLQYYRTPPCMTLSREDIRYYYEMLHLRN